jgi:hypothetical protein
MDATSGSISRDVTCCSMGLLIAPLTIAGSGLLAAATSMLWVCGDVTTSALAARAGAPRFMIGESPRVSIPTEPHAASRPMAQAGRTSIRPSTATAAANRQGFMMPTSNRTRLRSQASDFA